MFTIILFRIVLVLWAAVALAPSAIAQAQTPMPLLLAHAHLVWAADSRSWFDLVPASGGRIDGLQFFVNSSRIRQFSIGTSMGDTNDEIIADDHRRLLLGDYASGRGATFTYRWVDFRHPASLLPRGSVALPSGYHIVALDYAPATHRLFLLASRGPDDSDSDHTGSGYFVATMTHGRFGLVSGFHPIGGGQYATVSVSPNGRRLLFCSDSDYRVVTLTTPRYSIPPEHQITQTPTHWGAYTVTVERDGDTGAGQMCVRDRHQKIVREVDYGTYSALYTQQLNPSGFPDLVIVAWDGSNLYCCHTTFIFAQKNGRVRNVAIITGGEGRFQRLGRHGLQFVMPTTGVLEFACDVCHACEPNLPVVLDWNGGRPTDATARYPTLSEAAAKSYRKAFLHTCAVWYASHPAPPEEGMIGPAAGYYANAFVLGHGRQTYRWVMRRLPTPDTRQWFHDCARVIRYQIAQTRHMDTVSQAKILTTSRVNVFAHPPRPPEMDRLSTEGMP
jgi:hypothetical protein